MAVSDPYPRESFKPQTVTDLPEGLVLFDGVCVLCSAWVNFIIPRDPQGHFRFASIQGPTGARIAARLGIDPDSPATNAVIIGNEVYFKSDSALAVLSHLRGWRWTRILKAMPRPCRDWLYDRIARNRYRLFGRTPQCALPSADHASRFVDHPAP